MSSSQFDHRCITASEYIQASNNVDGILNQIARLQVQATIQKTLVEAATTLQSQKKNPPDQPAVRVKHMLEFVFGKSSRRNEERSVRLRKLECNALKFCGLTYTVRNILDLPESQFEYLLEYIAEFVHSRELVQHLYRDDINKFLNPTVLPEYEQLFRDFLTASGIATPIKTFNVVTKDDSSPLKETNAVALAEPTLLVAQDFYRLAPPRPPKRRREEVTDGASGSTESTLVSTELIEQGPLSQALHEWSLTGNVFQLTIEDVKEVAETDEVGSNILLTLPLRMRTPPFITVPISNGLALRYTSKFNYLQEFS